MKSSAKARSRKLAGPDGLELCEQAVHLLRQAPLSVLAVYYIGSLPFWLGFLYFWADMSRDPFAASRAAEASLGVALLYLWMKCLHALFASRLRAALTLTEPSRLPPGQFPRFVASQLFLHGMSVVVIPLAALITLPLGFVLTYYQNVTVLGASAGAETLRALHARAARMSTLWPGQTHQVLLVLILFSGVVALNLAALILFLPVVLRTVTGTETVFSMAGAGMMNTTFLLVVLALTHLLMDPLVKSVYLLRCFYGESMESAEDLRVELLALAQPRTRRTAAVVAAVLMLLAGGAPPTLANGSAPASASPGQSVSAPDLDRAFSEVMKRREFRWRLPRELAPRVEQEKGWLATFISEVASTLKELISNVFKAIGRFWEWLIKLIWGKSSSSVPSGSSGSGINWLGSLQGIALLLLAFVAAVLGVWLFRVIKSRRATAEEAVVTTPVTVPDVARDDVTADELPEDGWIALARELMEAGDLRLAQRALYLACLATLARRGVVSVAKFKSNVDYEKEVRRRSHARPDLVAAFSQNVALFDRSWYGTHEVTPDVIGRFTANLQALQSGGDNA